VPAFSPAQAVIAAMITPALLILASASLIATALVRLSRIVDRIRKLAEGRDGARLDRATELDRHERRARLALLAVTLFFCAVAVVVAAGISIAFDRALGGTVAWLPLALTFLGMALIVAGAASMVVESAYSAQQIAAEIAALRR
jgi:hypothetical protein